MYKRINKRIQKKKKEEELGLDDEAKEILGIQDTDSDESDSSDDQSDAGSAQDGSDASEAESSDAGDVSKLKRKREPGIESDSSDMGEQDEEDEDEEEGSGSEDPEEDAPPMTIAQALVDPLYPVLQGSDARECIVCPGKEIKHAKMASIHIASSTHLRRMKRFAALASRVGDEDEDPRLLVAALDESARIAPKEQPPAKVATEPRVPRKDRRLAKRQRRQERRAAKNVEPRSPARATSQPQEQSAPTANSKSTTDHVLEKKLLSRQLEGIKKHKRAKPSTVKPKSKRVKA